MASAVRDMSQRLVQLAKLRSDIFGTTWNPERLRIGSKVLKARLRGPAMVNYYGERLSSFKKYIKAIPDLPLIDVYEQTRRADIEARKKRGKVTPKKGQGKRATMKKR